MGQSLVALFGVEKVQEVKTQMDAALRKRKLKEQEQSLRFAEQCLGPQKVEVRHETDIYTALGVKSQFAAQPKELQIPAKLQYMLYNPGTLCQAGRLRHILSKAKEHEVHICAMPGTCSGSTGKECRQEYMHYGWHVFV